MDYIGSKEKLNNWIFEIILKSVPDYKNCIFMDACAGSGSVSKYASNLDFKKIISNDIMTFPSHIVRGSVCLPSSKNEEAKSLIDEMNVLKGVNGFFYKNYSENSGRLYFSNENAKKIDALRLFIDDNANDIYVKSYLLYCLLEAVSSVSNTTGVQAAFLKSLKERALKPIVVKQMPTENKYQLIKCFNKNILSLLQSKKFRKVYQEDILYIDPPYNQRQYAPNYHLYETLVRYDNPEIYGKTGLRKWKEAKSDFCSKKTCISFTKKIIEQTTAKNIFISYNSDGLISLDEFKKEFPNIIVFEKEYKRYKSDSSNERNYNDKQLKEFLLEIKK